MTNNTILTKPTGLQHKSLLKDDILDLMIVIGDFVTLLNKETAALKTADFPSVDALQAEKKDIARRYQDLVVAMNSRKAEVDDLDMALREKFVRTRTVFTQTLQENMQTLERVRNSASRLVDRILNVARTSIAEEQTTNYSALGKAQAYKSTGLSVRLDQSL
jgi:hypothetical protein